MKIVLSIAKIGVISLIFLKANQQLELQKPQNTLRNL